MTAQISDRFIYKDEDYSIIGIRMGVLPSPQDFGMEPEMLHTACYRGYYSVYELTDEGLFLREMTLREKTAGIFL